ncbi:hypothetical protein AB8O64_35325 [Streptomyces sp. QH1-20]|uniref:hypothetical protein n=1 Tax=Streptomyces sp. QH1-20 TaxID=3240934 RepID=UPI003519252C
MSDETANDRAYVPVGSLQGLLQRGRGLGALLASEDPANAADTVHDCVRHDWRWDSVDDRHLYLARLYQELALPPATLAGLLAGDEDDCERATRVLELLALSGSTEAREILRGDIGEGEHWVDVLESVADVWPVEWWDDLADIARVRLTGEERLLQGSKPWARWATGAPTTVAHPPRLHAIEGGSTGRRLLSILADTDSTDGAKAQALRTLAGRPPEPGLLPLVAGLGTADGERPLPWLTRAVERLGVLAVPEAREWAAAERPWLSWTGIVVLADHGDTQDIPALVQELTTHEETHRWCGPDRVATGLARFGQAAADAAPILRRFWLRTPHSHERPAYLKALAAIEPVGLDQAYTESLWDCETNARLLGVTSAPDLPHVRQRLTQLRDDPMEEHEVRAAAEARLAKGGR